MKVYTDLEECPKRLINKAKRVMNKLQKPKGVYDFYTQLVWDSDSELLELKSFIGDTPLYYQTFSK